MNDRAQTERVLRDALTEELDPEVLRVATAAANQKRDLADARAEIERLTAENAIKDARLQERDAQIHRLESQLLISTMRLGQHASVFDQIKALARVYDDSMEAAGDEAGSQTRQ